MRNLNNEQMDKVLDILHKVSKILEILVEKQEEKTEGKSKDDAETL